MIFKVKSRFLFFSLSFFLNIFFIVSPVLADSNFYSLAERWDKANASGSAARKEAVDQSFTSALLRSAPSESSTSIPHAPALTRSLDELSKSQRVVEIEQNQTLFVKSSDPIVKFVATEDEKLAIESVDSNTLGILGINVGPTFVHIWTVSEGRHTFQIQVIPQTFAPSLTQIRQQEAIEKSRTFKFGYSNDRDAFYTGTKFRTKKRDSLEFDQNFTMEGDTPYGLVTSHAQTQDSTGKNLLADAQLALTDGKVGPLKNFNAAVGDSRVEPNLMVFPGARIRGTDVESWNDNKNLTGEGFYGREQTSIIGTLIPGIVSKRTLDAYLDGGVVKYAPNDNAKFTGGLFRGSGDGRGEDLPKIGTGLKGDINLGPNLTFKPEEDYDSQHTAERESLIFRSGNFRLRGEYRDIGKNFNTLIGAPGGQGELGYLLEGNASFFDNFILTGSTDIFRDRLIPNPDDLRAFNIHTDLSLSFSPWEGSTALLGYQGTDDTGRQGPSRQSSYSVQFNQRVWLLGHRGTIFTRYQNRDNVILNNNVLDYHVDQVSVGYSTPIIWNIDFSISEEMNFLNEYNIPASSVPRATVYDLDYSSRIGKTPFYTDLQFQIRDEENTESINSFMSGYDTTEFTGNLYYREYENMELFLTGSFKNYRNESATLTTQPRVEVQFLTGARYLWDTDYRWSPVGSFNGFVYKDMNGDGRKQADEPGLEGVLVTASGGRQAVTDKQGFYELKSVAGRQATLTLDTSRIPYGYAPTTSVRQTLPIQEGVTRHVDFGVSPRSEITGIVFNDLKGDGKYDVAAAQGVRKVRIKLENGAVTRTNNLGVYSFSDVIAGPHTVMIDVAALPEGYLPEGVPRQTITLYEGIRYELNFPLHAQRMITGRVFVDTNGNKHIDPNEKALAGVKVLFGTQTILTDKDGWYLFEDLPNGSYELTVDESTLPAGYAKPQPIKINLPIEPITITDADIPVPEK